MRGISFFILCLALLSGCAGIRTQQDAPEGNLIDVARLGIYADDSNNPLTVTKLTKDFPAYSAGIRTGDILVSIDGIVIKSRRSYANILSNKRPGENVLLVINRNGEAITFDMEPRWGKRLRTGIAIDDMLLDNKKVTLAVIISDVKNSSSNVPRDWEISTRNQIQSERESGLLEAFGGNKYFSLVDRSRLKNILDEYQFSQAGFVSDKLRVKIGEMTGATHLMDISFSRFKAEYNSYKDIFNSRLIEVESGKILAVDQVIIRK